MLLVCEDELFGIFSSSKPIDPIKKPKDNEQVLDIYTSVSFFRQWVDLELDTTGEPRGKSVGNAKPQHRLYKYLVITYIVLKSV